MIRTLAIAAGLGIAMGFSLGIQNAAAMTIGPHTPIPDAMVSTDSLVQQVQWGPRCRRVAHFCAERYGWQTRRFYRCMWNRDCGRD